MYDEECQLYSLILLTSLRLGMSTHESPAHHEITTLLLRCKTNASCNMVSELVKPTISTDPSTSSGIKCVHLIHTASITYHNHNNFMKCLNECTFKHITTVRYKNERSF